MLTIVKNNYKKILITILVLISIPLISIISKVILTYGEYVGTQARMIVEKGVCSK